LQQSKLQEAKRCGELACREHQGAPTLLELGLCEWALSRVAENDEKAADELRAAERLLTESKVQSSEVGRLTLSRFYRLTFKSLDACEHFPAKTEAMESLRRVLRESHVYAEAATQLWFNDYPESTYRPHLIEAKHLLNT